jgi:hypothetical protein
MTESLVAGAGRGGIAAGVNNESPTSVGIVETVAGPFCGVALVVGVGFNSQAAKVSAAAPDSDRRTERTNMTNLHSMNPAAKTRARAAGIGHSID